MAMRCAAEMGLMPLHDSLGALAPERLDVLRGKQSIGILRDVEVTDTVTEPRPVEAIRYPPQS